MNALWQRYEVTMDFVTKLCASVPGDSEMIAKWLESRAPKVRPAQSRGLDEIQAEVLETIAAGRSEGEGGDGEPDFVPLVFQRVNGVLMVRLATIVRGHLKDCAYQVQTYLAGAVEGEKSFSVRFKNAVYFPAQPDPLVTVLKGTPYVAIQRADGDVVKEPDGVHEKPVHFITRQGPRSALKGFEYVLDARIVYPLYILRQPPRQVRQKKEGKYELVNVPGKLVVSEDDLKQVMLYGGVHGYGGERSDDGGRYAFTLATTEEG